MQVSILNLFKIPLKIKIKHLIETTMKALSKMSLLAVVNLKRRLMKLHNPNHRKLVPMLSLMLSKMPLQAVINLKRRLMKLFNLNHSKLVPMLSLMLSKMSLLAVINLTRRLMKLFNLNHSKLVPITRLMLMIKVPNQITIAKIQTPATLMILLEKMMK